MHMRGKKVPAEMRALPQDLGAGSGDGLQADSSVCIHGLVGRLELNGRNAVFGNYSDEIGRWECRLEDCSVINVKPDNLIKLPDRNRQMRRVVRSKTYSSEGGGHIPHH